MILSSFCDLLHIQSVIDLFCQTAQYRVEPALSQQNTGKITKIGALYGRFSTNARIYGHTRLNTGDLGTLGHGPYNREPFLSQCKWGPTWPPCGCISGGPVCCDRGSLFWRLSLQVFQVLVTSIRFCFKGDHKQVPLV